MGILKNISNETGLALTPLYAGCDNTTNETNACNKISRINKILLVAVVLDIITNLVFLLLQARNKSKSSYTLLKSHLTISNICLCILHIVGYALYYFGLVSTIQQSVDFIIQNVSLENVLQCFEIYIKAVLYNVILLMTIERSCAVYFPIKLKSWFSRCKMKIVAFILYAVYLYPFGILFVNSPSFVWYMHAVTLILRIAYSILNLTLDISIMRKLVQASKERQTLPCSITPSTARTAKIVIISSVLYFLCMFLNHIQRMLSLSVENLDFRMLGNTLFTFCIALFFIAMEKKNFKVKGIFCLLCNRKTSNEPKERKEAS